MRLKLHLDRTLAEEVEDPTPADLERSVSLLHRNAGAKAELTYFDTRLIIRGLEGDWYLVEYSDPTIGTWTAERSSYPAEPPVPVVIEDRERLLRGAQLVTQTDALHALEDFLDRGTRSGRLAWSPIDGA